MIEIRFFCDKCKHDHIKNTSKTTKQMICPNCGTKYPFEQIIGSIYSTKKELDRLSHKFHIYYYARVEFEQDFKLYNSTDSFFDDAIKIMQEGSANIIFPPRFDIVAYQLKAADGYRCMLHADSVNSTLYNIPASPHIHISFRHAIEHSYLHTFPADAQESESTLWDLAHLAFHSIRYATLYERFVQTHRSFFYPIYTFR